MRKTRAEKQRDMYSNPHVVRLMTCSEEQKREWCIRIFEQLKFDLEMPWGAINNMTGRTRQTWNNVMEANSKARASFINSVSSNLTNNGFHIDTDKFLGGYDGHIVTPPPSEPPTSKAEKRTAKVRTSEIIVRCARLVREDKMTNEELLDLIDNL